MPNFSRFWIAGLLSLIGAFAQPASANDDIFPPAPAAASSINFDGRGFLIHGKRTFIASGGMEYARVPHALWRDRLLRLKRAGFNCVEVYTFWNWHEPRPNVFDFTGDHDLDAFLKTVKSLDMYAICRVGPYYCAEWDSGGYPIWLRFAPGVRVREDNPQFMAAVHRFWSHLLPIVAANQINHGGSVILVQLENEDPQGWGTEMPNSYFTHLRGMALALGIQVPCFFSGLHHGGDPAGDTAGDKPWSSAGRTSPWFTTEFWTVWFDRYGESEDDAESVGRRMWKVLAYGGNGLNFYMFHGGSNFGYTNNNEDAASYDYGAAIGQAGDLRPDYYHFKRAALFARSFESILEDSDNATDDYKSAATDATVRVTARKSPSGTILFLDNPTGNAVKTQVKEADGTLFPAEGTLTLAPSQIAPIVHDFPLLPGVTLEHSTPLLGILHQGSTTTLVAYGPPGDVSELRFRLTGTNKVIHDRSIQEAGSRLTVVSPIDADLHLMHFQVGSQVIRVLVMDTANADSTWFVDSNIFVKSGYVGDVTTVNGKLHLTAEGTIGGGDKANITTWVYEPKDLLPAVLWPFPQATRLPDAPTLSSWKSLPGDVQAAPSYPDTKWKASADPLQMGADGDSSAYAWYRATVNVPQAGAYLLRFTDGGDRASVFVNGRHLGTDTIKHGVAVTVPAGTSHLAVLTAHDGRSKLIGILGPIDAADVKGLRGPVILDNAILASRAITQWRVKADADADHAAPPAGTTGAGWADGDTSTDIFHGRSGFAWYVASLPALTGTHYRAHFENVDDNATVFLNGKQVAAHQGWGQPFNAPLDSAWNPNSTNTLAILVENVSGSGGIQGAATLNAVSGGNEMPITGWKMHGGVAEPAALTGWKLGTAASADGAPMFYRATFQAAPPAATGPHPILRVTTTGLSHGFIWLNGHNLGRYPEKIPVNGLYLPEPWLNAAGNSLVIFDEAGNAPSQVKLTVEQAASRFVVPMTER